jgi:hypothetical protein
MYLGAPMDAQIYLEAPIDARMYLGAPMDAQLYLEAPIDAQIYLGAPIDAPPLPRSINRWPAPGRHPPSLSPPATATSGSRPHSVKPVHTHARK